MVRHIIRIRGYLLNVDTFLEVNHDSDGVFDLYLSFFMGDLVRPDIIKSRGGGRREGKEGK